MKKRATAGFTIIEVLIVMAVTAALFVSAAIMVGGRQNVVEFSQAIGDIESQLQQTINQVGSGYYAQTSQLKKQPCTAPVGGNSITFSSAGGDSQQGSNTGCIFMGLALEFGVGPANKQEFITYTVAGLQNNEGSIATANPKLLARGSDTTLQNFPDAGVHTKLRNGVHAVKMTYSSKNKAVTDQTIGGVAFLSTLGDFSTGSLSSGAQQLNMAPLFPARLANFGTNFGADRQTFVDTTDANMAKLDETMGDFNPDGGVQICFDSGTTNQSALMTIGGGSRALSVTHQVFQTKGCKTK